MSRRKKRSQTAHNSRRHEQKRPSWDVVIQDTAACFTCSRQIAKDFVAQCDSRLEDLEADIAFNRAAHQMGAGRPGRAQDLAQTLAEFVTEREQEAAALTALRQRFAALAADEFFHEHLHPVEQWRDFLGRTILPDRPSP
jgi:uncharacterized coiled-coil protein SlyX